MGLLRLLGIEKYLKKVKTYVDEKTANIPLSSLSDEVKDKLVGVEKHNRLEWEYVDADDACFAKSKTNKIIVGGAEYSLNEDDIVDVIIDGVNFGLVYTSDNRIKAYGGNEENIDILANNVFVLDDGTIEEKYIPETIARKEYVDERFGALNTNVLKYVSNPYPIKLGETLPNDLLSIITDNEDGFIKANITSLCVANIPDDTAGYDCYYAITGCVPDDAQITLSNGENWYYFDDEKCFRDYDA